MDSWERFNDTDFPSHDKFYLLLTDSNISETEYKRGFLIWNRFNIETLGEYHDLYLILDVSLLYDVMFKV